MLPLALEILKRVEIMTGCAPGCCKTEMPIACRPEEIPVGRREEHRKRLSDIVLGRMRSSEAGESGFTMRYDADCFPELARWIELERLCCPFLTFNLQVSAEKTTLDLSGPEGTKEYLMSLMGR